MKRGKGVGSAASCSDLFGRPFYFKLHLHLALITELLGREVEGEIYLIFGKVLAIKVMILFIN